jgi:Protein tyrosine/serine phosphatase
MIIEDIILQNVVNFRDFRGYKTRDNRKVKKGLVYRSAGFYTATEKDMETIFGFGIKHIVDFRETAEFVKSPDDFPPNIIIHEIPAIIENDYTQNKTLNFFELLHSDIDIEGIYLANDFLREVYEFIAFDNKAFAKVFELIEKKEVPILFHCAGGKDRTGVMAALWLLLLGVDYATIIEDYLYSNEYIERSGYAAEQIKIKNITNPEAIKAVYDMVGVKEEYLATTLATITEKYGSMEEYFFQEYGLDERKIADIRDFYLE